MIRKRMLERGFSPFTVDVEKLPKVQAKTVAELVAKMHKLTDDRMAKK
jgi:hypothetical protein